MCCPVESSFIIIQGTNTCMHSNFEDKNKSLLFMPQAKTVTSVIPTSETKLWVALTCCTDPHQLLATWRRVDISAVDTASAFGVRW